MPAQLAAYRDALDRLAATARTAAADELGCALPPVRVEVWQVPPGHERLATDYIDAVRLAISDVAQLRPPPEGGTTIYGVCHEIGHLIVARAAPGTLPVVWDEALAHLLATDVLIPAVWAVHGRALWPDPYPDYPERETRLPDEPAGHLHGSVATLRRLTGELRTLAGRVGVDGLLAALARLDPAHLRVHTLGGALRQATEPSTDH